MNGRQKTMEFERFNQNHQSKEPWTFSNRWREQRHKTYTYFCLIPIFQENYLSQKLLI